MTTLELIDEGIIISCVNTTKRGSKIICDLAGGGSMKYNIDDVIIQKDKVISDKPKQTRKEINFENCVIAAQQLKLHLLESRKALDCGEKRNGNDHEIGCIMRNDPDGLRLITCFEDGVMVDSERGVVLEPR